MDPAAQRKGRPSSESVVSSVSTDTRSSASTIDVWDELIFPVGRPGYRDMKNVSFVAMAVSSVSMTNASAREYQQSGETIGSLKGQSVVILDHRKRKLPPIPDIKTSAKK